MQCVPGPFSRRRGLGTRLLHIMSCKSVGNGRQNPGPVQSSPESRVQVLQQPLLHCWCVIPALPRLTKRKQETSQYQMPVSKGYMNCFTEKLAITELACHRGLNWRLYHQLELTRPVCWTHAMRYTTHELILKEAHYASVRLMPWKQAPDATGMDLSWWSL